MNTNVDRLAMISVVGEVSHPKVGGSVYRVGQDGAAHVVPGTGGITYNVRVGSPACGWKGDHLEPGVSTRASDSGDNGAYNTFACVGNPAKVVSGDAKGGEGYVVGTHGGIEHVMVEFADAVLDDLLPGDKILVKSFGQGLELADYPGVAVRSLDPRLLECWGIESDGDTLAVPVTHTVPAKVMGSGLGANTAVRGDYDIQMFSRDVVDEYGLADLKLGDFVAILDADHTYGRIYYTGAVSVGVIVHSDSYVAGHGPGVATVLTSREGKIRPVIDGDANSAELIARADG
jgi:hypothetical protein